MITNYTNIKNNNTFYINKFIINNNTTSIITNI